MSNRKRNMLEAFQASAKEAQGEHTPHSTGGAGGPFAEESRETERERRPERRLEHEPRLEREPEVDLRAITVPSLPQALARLPLGPIAAGLLGVLMLVFWLGFLAGGTSTVEAADEKAEGDFELVERETPAQSNRVRRDSTPTPSSTSGTPYDGNFNALRETGITLRVATYDQNKRNVDLAWETYDYLLQQRLPVVRPVATSKNIFIFVGAERSISGLEELQDKVHALEGPNGGQPFSDAYPVNIKDYVQR